MAQGDFTGALPHFEEALRLAPGLYFLRVLLNDGSVIGEAFVKE